jgi:sulfopyruvate decarboxylase TPP-binding subunit
MASTSTILTATKVLDELKKCGITHIVWLPDSEAKFMYDAMMIQKDIKLVQVCREGEAIAVATGLLLGGKNPVVLHQNTGLFESGDSVRGLAIDLHLPILLMIGYRGFKHDATMTDTAAIYTEPILKAWGINYHLIESDKDVSKISDAYNESQRNNKPVAILIGMEYA